jgi:hypothetical protein
MATRLGNWTWGVGVGLLALIIILSPDSPLWSGRPGDVLLGILVLIAVVATPFLTLAVIKSRPPALLTLPVLLLNLAVGAGAVVATLWGAIWALPVVVPVLLNLVMLAVLLARKRGERGQPHQT